MNTKKTIKITDYTELYELNHPIYLYYLDIEKNGLNKLDVWKFLERLWLSEYLIKRHFNSKFKYSLKPNQMKEYKPLCELYYVLFLACEKLHSLVANQYYSALNWWSFLVAERVIDGVNCGTKRDTIDYLKWCNRQISEFNNPIDKKYQHTWLLIKGILKFSEQNYHSFHKPIFIPLKNALANYTKNYESSAHKFVKFEEDGSVFAIGNGGSKFSLNESITFKDLLQGYKKTKN